MKRLLTSICFLLILTGLSCGAKEDSKEITEKVPVERPRIEVAFLLDNTGSMASMISTAKEKIWTIATSLTQTEPAPDIQMSLVGYRDRGDTYVTKLFNLTDDIDSIYGELMAMVADGGGDGPESVNQALYEAVTQIEWSADTSVYKVAFLVGDFPPHLDYEDDVQWPKSCSIAVKRDITINTLLMGSNGQAEAIWKEIAKKTGGEFTKVDYSANRVSVSTPYDAEMAKLTDELDDSRLYYGSSEVQEKMLKRKEKAKRMMASSDVRTKAKRGVYNTTHSGKKNFLGKQELLSGIEDGSVSLDTLKKEQLPKEMRTMSKKEQKDFVQDKITQRKEVKNKLKELEKKRQEYIKKDMEARSIGTEEGFSGEIFEMMKEQSKEKGIELKGSASH